MFRGVFCVRKPQNVKNPGPEDLLALICLRRGLLNVSCKYNRFLEYWSNGVMEKPIYANLFSMELHG